MEKKTNRTFLLIASAVGFAYWIMVLLPLGVESFGGIDISDSQIGFFEGISNLIKSGGLIWLLLMVLIIVVFIAPSVLNLIGWRKNNKTMIIIAITLYLLTLNASSFLLCVIGILWDNNDEFNILEKKTNPLFFIAGALGVFGLVFWFLPLMVRTDGSGSDSWFSAILSFVKETKEPLTFRIIASNYVITVLSSFVIAIAISFFSKLRNNAKRVLIATISYIVSLSIPSVVLCFIGFLYLKKLSVRMKSVEAK